VGAPVLRTGPAEDQIRKSASADFFSPVVIALITARSQYFVDIIAIIGQAARNAIGQSSRKDAMFFILGYIILCCSVYGGYALAGGHLAALFQPIELFIIGGGTIGFFLAATREKIIKQVFTSIPLIFKSDLPTNNMLGVLEKVLGQLSSGSQEAAGGLVHKAYEEMKSLPALEVTVLDHMAESVRLAGLPGMVADEFVRMAETDLQSCSAEAEQAGRAVCNAGHFMVAMGVLVAVLGFIHAGYVSDHAEYMVLLSHSLVGVFLGILIGWGLVLPAGLRIKARHTKLQMQYRCINLAFGARLRGLPPGLALEAGRMALPPL
jgi:chemotaxis protein MotA